MSNCHLVHNQLWPDDDLLSDRSFNKSFNVDSLLNILLYGSDEFESLIIKEIKKHLNIFRDLFSASANPFGKWKLLEISFNMCK